MTAERILVTGATGRVGSAVVDWLSETSHPVTVASRDPTAARERFRVDHEFVDFGFDRPETWGEALQGAHGLFLLYPPGTSVDSIRAFVDAAVRTGTGHVTFLSVLGAEKLPVLPHRRIERHVSAADVRYTFLRAAYFMQNLSDVHRPEVVERDELFVPAGNGALGFVDARDVGAVAAVSLTEPEHADRAYDLTGPRALTFDDAAAVFSDVLDRRITYANPSRRAFARRLLGRGVSPGLVAFMLAEYQVTRLGLTARTTEDVRHVLGRDPTSLRTFVADHRGAFTPTGTD